MSPFAIELTLLLVVAAIGSVLATRAKGISRGDRWLAWLVPLGAGVILLRLFERVAQGPYYLFNATRVAAAIGMANGYNVLPGPDEGPALDFMYGPVSAAAYTPAASMPTPSAAIWLGIVMSFAFLLGPFAWTACGVPARRSWVVSALTVVCFGILFSYDAPMAMAATTIHADAPALGLAGAACACLLCDHGSASDRRMLASACLALLAVWAKQTAAPIVLVLPATVWLRDGWRGALRFSLWMGAAGIAVSGLFLLWFGLEGIVFTMFQMPGGHAWATAAHPWGTADGRLQAALESLARLSRLALPSMALVLAVAAASYQRGLPVRRWMREQPWTSLAFVGVAMVPISALGGAKVGAANNSYAITTYFLMGAGVLGLAQLAHSGRSWRAAVARLALAGIVVFAVGDELRGERRQAFERGVVEIREWRSNPVERATAFARRHPDQVLFVWNPLIGLYSDGRLYHSLHGIQDRMLAGYEVGADLRQRHLPPDLRYVAVRRQGIHSSARPFPTFTEERRFAELPHHRVWVRASPGEDRGGSVGRPSP